MAGGSKGIVDGTPESISSSGGRGMNRSWLNRDRRIERHTEESINKLWREGWMFMAGHSFSFIPYL